MEITIKQTLDFFDLTNQCWCGALDTLRIIEEHSKEDELMLLLSEICDEDTTLTSINDLLRFDDEWVLEQLGIKGEEDDDE